MGNINRLLIALVVTIVINNILCAQSAVDSFYLQQYNNTNGLSNSSINDLITDSKGLLWIATWDGLNIYSGSAFHVLTQDINQKGEGLRGNVIQNLSEDKRGSIWITTVDGVSRYDKKSGVISNFFSDNIQKGVVSEHEYQLAIDTSGKIYCYSGHLGLQYYDARANIFKRAGFNFKEWPIKIGFDQENRLFVLGKDKTLSVYIIQNNRLIRQKTVSRDVVDLFLCNKELFITTTNKLLLRVDHTKLTQLCKLRGNVNAILLYKSNYLLAMEGGGLEVYDNDFTPSTFLTGIKDKFYNTKISSLAMSDNDILWIGTDGNGLLKMYPKTNFFDVVHVSGGENKFNYSVRAFAKVNNDLWVATKGGGIANYGNLERSQAKHLYTSPGSIDNNAVYSMKWGIDNLLYIGSDGSGISVYDIKSGKFFKWNQVDGYSKSLEFSSVYAFFQDKDSSIWLGTSGFGLLHMKIIRKSNNSLSLLYVKQYKSSTTGLPSDIIYTISASDDNNLWVGCRYGGLSLFNKRTERVKNFKAFTYKGSLSNNDVLYTFCDSKKRLWVGTSYGLNILSEVDALKTNPVFRRITMQNGLPNNTIHGISEDNNGDIWVSTNKGIAKISPGDFKVTYYQLADGLQNNEFSDGAVFKDYNGRMFFGGISGFNHFYPGNIKNSEKIYNLLISVVSIGGSAENASSLMVVNPGVKNDIPNFSVKRNSNYFEIEASVINFINADKCEYSYFLEGADNDWHYTKNDGKIAYNNLAPGAYLLKVKWSNGEGQWSPETRLMHFEVQPYFLLSVYMKSLYFLLLAILGYFYFRYRKNRREINQRLEMEKVLRTKEEEIHQNRISFFTNIAHELQTPLTLVMGSFDQFMEKSNITVKAKGESNYYFSMIRQQAAKLTYLLHQLFEFRRADTGYLKNRFSYVDISGFLKNLAEPFEALSRKEEISYRVKILGNIAGWIDKDKIEKIVFNLLSNAFKYTPKREKIIFSARENKAAIEIEVFNSGVLLEDNEIQNLFEKFYTVNSPASFGKYGTGIGLAFTAQLVSLLRGKIGVFNTSEGVCFRVELPIWKNNELPVESKTGEISDEPSHLYRAITDFTEAQTSSSAIINNKNTVIDQIAGENRDVIVIVEDDHDLRFLLRDILSKDYVVYEAGDGVKAIGLINQYMPQLVISDVLMPNMDGLELCNRIKSTTSTCHIPVLLLSARSAEDQHIEGYEAGADAYISKPFNARYLKMRVKKLIQYQQNLQNLFQGDKIVSAIGSGTINNNDKEFLEKIYRIIEEELSSPELNAGKLEKELFISKMQLYRKLKSLTGMTPNEFIKNIRLQKAASLLSSSDLPIIEVFYTTGFNNQSYFFREFKKKYNSAPGEYRDQQKLQTN